MLLLLIILLLLCALWCNFLAGRFSACQDALKHFPNQSIFKKIASKKKFVFGIVSEYWFNLNGKDGLAKYEDYNSTKPKRKWKILFFKIHIVQLSDAWHWYKMWNVAMEKLDGVFLAFASAFAFAQLWINYSFSIDYTLLIIAVALVCYFWLAGFVWNVSFNLHYDKWLRM